MKGDDEQPLVQPNSMVGGTKYLAIVIGWLFLSILLLMAAVHLDKKQSTSKLPLELVEVADWLEDLAGSCLNLARDKVLIVIRSYDNSKQQVVEVVVDNPVTVEDKREGYLAKFLNIDESGIDMETPVGDSSLEDHGVEEVDPSNNLIFKYLEGETDIVGNYLEDGKSLSGDLEDVALSFINGEMDKEEFNKAAFDILYQEGVDDEVIFYDSQDLVRVHVENKENAKVVDSDIAEKSIKEHYMNIIVKGNGHDHLENDQPKQIS